MRTITRKTKTSADRPDLDLEAITSASRAAYAEAARATLRDHFAMAALTGQLSNPNFDTNATAADLAKTSYGIAKAMLAAREAG